MNGFSVDYPNVCFASLQFVKVQSPSTILSNRGINATNPVLSPPVHPIIL